MEFFKNVPGKLDLHPFNEYHIPALVVFLFLAILIYIFRNNLRDTRLDFRVRLIATIIAFTLEMIYQSSNFIFDTLFIKRLLPFELCAMTLWLSFILNINKSKNIFNILYFWGIGAVSALLFPDISGIGPDKMRYFHYFGVHMYIVLTIIYFIIVKGYTIDFKDFVKSIAILFPITMIIRFIDLTFYHSIKLNYMFLVEPPDIMKNLFAFPVGSWTYYFLLVSIAILICYLCYIPWYFTKQRNVILTEEIAADPSQEENTAIHIEDF